MHAYDNANMVNFFWVRRLLHAASTRDTYMYYTFPDVVNTCNTSTYNINKKRKTA